MIGWNFLRKVFERWLPDEHKNIGEQVPQCPIERRNLAEKLSFIREQIKKLIIATGARTPRKWLISLISQFINKLQSPPPTS